MALRILRIVDISNHNMRSDPINNLSVVNKNPKLIETYILYAVIFII